VSDSDVKSLALFFFFTMLDEKRALHAASQAFEICRQKANTKSDLKTPVLIVLATQNIWDLHKKRLIRGRPQYSLESGWKLPEAVDFNAWKSFQKNAPEEELLALVWSLVLGISDEDISAGLGITQGTIRFRVGRALRKLGSAQPQMNLVGNP
jgi:hypothetical protein